MATSSWTNQNSLLSVQQTVLNVQGGTGGAILTVNGQPDPAVWVRTLGGSGSADGANIKQNAYLLGYGGEVRPGLIIGEAFGNTQAETETATQTVQTHATGLYLYGLYNRGAAFVDGTVTAGTLKTDSRRSIVGTGLVATGSASGSYRGLSLKAGYRLHPIGSVKQVFLIPYIGAGYLHTHRSAYAESGAQLLNLTYAAADDNLGTYSAGARLGADLHPRPNLVVSPWVMLGMITYTGNRNQGQEVTLGSVHQVLPASGAPDSAELVNAGLALMASPNWSAQLVYHGQFSAHTHMNTADLKVVYRW